MKIYKHLVKIVCGVIVLIMSGCATNYGSASAYKEVSVSEANNILHGYNTGNAFLLIKDLILVEKDGWNYIGCISIEDGEGIFTSLQERQKEEDDYSYYTREYRLNYWSNNWISEFYDKVHRLENNKFLRLRDPLGNTSELEQFDIITVWYKSKDHAFSPPTVSIERFEVTGKYTKVIEAQEADKMELQREKEKNRLAQQAQQEKQREQRQAEQNRLAELYRQAGQSYGNLRNTSWGFSETNYILNILSYREERIDFGNGNYIQEIKINNNGMPWSDDLTEGTFRVSGDTVFITSPEGIYSEGKIVGNSLRINGRTYRRIN